MSHIYRPTIQIGSNFYEVPTPLIQCGERYENVVKTAKIPLVDGIVVTNVSGGPMQVSFAGFIHEDTREEMLTEKDNLKSRICGQTPFNFYRYYDSANNNYRWYQDSIGINITFDHTHQTVTYVPFTFTILVPDGNEYEQVSGAGDASPDTTVNLYGPVNIRLSVSRAGAGGSPKFQVRDSNGNVLFQVDSAGNVQALGPFMTVDSIS